MSTETNVMYSGLCFSKALQSDMLATDWCIIS